MTISLQKTLKKGSNHHYIVFGDVTLREMAREYPTDERAMRKISGMGEQKLERFGAQFMDAILKHTRTYPKHIFSDSLET